MELFVSAGEASSDIHCAHLLRELKKRVSVQSFGLGGDHLAAEGTQLLMHNREFSVMGGPLEVISKLPKRRALERLLEKRLFESRPDGAILVDNGEINLRLASLLHFFDVPVVYFIPPKVWVWRYSRIEKIAQHVDLVLSILPFEEPMYKEWEIPFRYVGNPLIDELPVDLTQVQAKKILGISESEEVLTVLPGSRHNEIAFHAQPFSQAVKIFESQLPTSAKKPVVVIPVAPSLDFDQVVRAFEPHLPGAKFFSKAQVGDKVSASHLCLKAARAALVKSGTSTLEGALLGTPMVLSYDASRSSKWLFKHITGYKGFLGMVNLFLAKSPESALGWKKREEPVVPELILELFSPENIAAKLLEIYVDGPKRNEMLRALARSRELVLPARELGTSPMQAAANAAFELFEKCGAIHA